ncbi:MAG: undecaprenyl/decaprenyl-phosphate alpha-N-acetylglucosaminyl 1-phosphate transferase, partial [Coriobacteriales bacterium]|nr:undecaprenyl/decaprenyl-phosphate alpha-N-acetylglucosaminyl 1-phosphate transferase [Coriobacteriales bacterium]
MDDISLLHAAVLAAVAFAATFVLVPPSIRLAQRLNAIDYPGPRRINTQPMPRLGGLALFGGLIISVGFELVGEIVFGWSGFYSNSGHLVINYPGVVLGLAVMVLVGAIDDVHQLSPVLKFAGQIIAAIIIVMAGVQLDQIKNPFGAGFLYLGWLDYPLTVLYLVAFANIINLIDGMDGLAAGITAISAIAMLVLAFTRGRLEV